MLTNIQRQSGFTIVELLIVIIVIAVLAGVTVTAFKGVSDRAYVSKAGTAVGTFQKLLEMYKSQYGTYPHPGGSSLSVCVGQTNNYPVVSGFAAGECGVDNSVVVSSQLNTALSAYTSSIPDGSLPYQMWTAGYPNDGGKRGVIYRYYNPGTAYQISYSLPNTQRCPIGVTSYQTSGGVTFTDCVIDHFP